MDRPKPGEMSGMKLAFYFRYNKIYIGKKTMAALGMPQYVHLLVDRKEKWLFVKACKRDKDAFNVYYSPVDGDEIRYTINEKPLLLWFSRIIGLDKDSQSIRFEGNFMEEENAVFFDMNKYTFITYGEQTKSAK